MITSMWSWLVGQIGVKLSQQGQMLPFNNAQSIFFRNNLVDVILQVWKMFNQFVFNALLDAGLELSNAGDTRIFKSKKWIS